MEFLGKQIFTTPTWLLDKKIIGLTGVQPVNVIAGLQSVATARLLSAGTMNKLINAETIDPNAYKITDLFDDLQKYIWGELATGATIDVYRRNLQKSYIDKLDAILHPPAAPAAAAQVPQRRGGGRADMGPRTPTDVNSVVKAHLARLRTKIKAVLPRVTDPMTKYHLQDVVGRINDALKTKDDAAGE
jgi:hypothetical protein